MILHEQEEKVWDNTIYKAILTGTTLVLKERIAQGRFCFWRWKRHYSLPFDHSHYEAWDKQMVGGWKLIDGVMPPFEPDFVLSKITWPLNGVRRRQ